MPSSGVAGSYGSFLFLVFREISILFSIVAVSVDIPTNSAEGSLWWEEFKWSICDDIFIELVKWSMGHRSMDLIVVFES